MDAGTVDRIMSIVSATSALTLKTCSTVGCRRLKARSWPVNSAARLALFSIWSSFWLAVSLLFNSRFEQLRVAEDRGEQIVEVVRNAAGQRADAVHLL